MIEHGRACWYAVFRLRLSHFIDESSFSHFGSASFRPCDTCFGFMLLVFCIFDKSVHAAITVCTWLDIMRLHLIEELWFNSSFLT